MNNTQKIAVLREAANRIEAAPEKFDWGAIESCNCGFVAQVAMGLDKDSLLQLMEQEIDEKLHYRGWAWNSGKAVLCKQTGVPLSKIFSTLLNIGFSFDELASLEMLLDPVIAPRVIDRHSEKIELDQYNELNCFNSQNAVFYLREWATMLEEQQIAATVQQKQVQIQPVSVKC